MFDLRASGIVLRSVAGAAGSAFRAGKDEAHGAGQQLCALQARRARARPRGARLHAATQQPRLTSSAPLESTSSRTGA